jgi:hypothetical protein
MKLILMLKFFDLRMVFLEEFLLSIIFEFMIFQTFIKANLFYENNNLIN